MKVFKAIIDLLAVISFFQNTVVATICFIEIYQYIIFGEKGILLGFNRLIIWIIVSIALTAVSVTWYENIDELE